MNWLAHLFLSEQNVDFQMGNILADPLKGKLWSDASVGLSKGMSVHKIIDAYTDSHKTVSKSKVSLRKKGLLKAVIIDLTYDYFLTKNWDTFCNIPVREFTHNFYLQAKERSEFLSPKAQSFINNLVHRDTLNKYHDLEQLQTSFERLDMRLSPRLLARETASGYFEAVEKNIVELEKDFMSFFPDLCSCAKEHLDQGTFSHWKI